MIEVKKKTISKIVFIFSFLVVSIAQMFLLFPAILISITGDTISDVNPFEPGTWFIPVLTSNLALLCLGVFYYKKILPAQIKSFFRFLINFEISQKLSLLIIIVLLSIYIAFTINDLSVYEGDEWMDFSRIEEVLDTYPFSEGEDIFTRYVKFYLLDWSEKIFDNIKVIPFLASISLLLLTYFFTVKISKKRFAGIIAMVVLMQSRIFLTYDTSATYTNIWTMFYLLSLYLIHKIWFLSPLSFILSIFTKPLTVVYLPLTLFFALRADLPKRKKTFVILSYIGLVLLIIGFLLVGINVAGNLDWYDHWRFWSGFSTLAFQLRFESLLVLFILPLTVGLYMTSRRGILEADSILILIIGILVSTPLLAGFTGFGIHPYRYIPLIVFFSIGVGMLFSKKINLQS